MSRRAKLIVGGNKQRKGNKKRKREKGKQEKKRKSKVELRENSTKGYVSNKQVKVSK